MSHLLSWLTDSLRRAAQKCGASGASVYVPTPWNALAPGVLVHVGSSEPLPEMATLEKAAEFFLTGDNVQRTPGGRSTPNDVLRSRNQDGWLLPIPLLSSLTPSMSLAEGPTRRLSDRAGGPPVIGWLGLAFDTAASPPALSGGWQSLLELASALASTYICFHGILQDPVTGLPGRVELNGRLRAELDRAAKLGTPFALLFIKVERLDEVNSRAGRATGDAVLRELLEMVQESIRTSDTVMRYGGATLALPLPDVNAAGALVVAEKIKRRLAQHGLSDGSVALPVALGVAAWTPADGAAPQVFDLLTRAHQALSVARNNGCGDVVVWKAEGQMAFAEPVDPLLGVFTGQAEKDYRNMRLLWEVLQVMSSETGATLARSIVTRMLDLFAVTRVAIFQPGPGGRLDLAAGQERRRETADLDDLVRADIAAEEWRLNEQAIASRAPQQCIVTGLGRGTTPFAAYAVPLVTDGRALGTIYVLGRPNESKLDHTDVPLLTGIAAQLALAFDREQLAAMQRLRDQHAHDRLKTEIDKLRRALNHTRLLFESPVMEQLLQTTRRIAATDATVLITGESGTGKEVLARTVHELSRRRDKPLVIVDCSAIPASLIESELFGRERGAFTGADRRVVGRLAQADGGTVFLDEIGELPLEVQAKLLRFVQEKTFTMVGGTHQQKVDARIVAATNRSLESEVRFRRFREDLYHRLNVLRLRIPSLRERPEDILHLARHFTVTFAREYDKPLSGLDASAEQCLADYHWPGNVRELQNTILQAVLLAEGTVLTAADLQIRAEAAASAGKQPPRLAPSPSPLPGERDVAPDGAPLRYEDARRQLAGELSAQIDAALSSGTGTMPPLGRWLARDLVLQAHRAAGSVAARAAALLGLPDTTFARQLGQARADAATTRQPDSWQTVQSRLADIIESTDRPQGSLADDLNELLLQLVASRSPANLSQAAGLMGITVPTLKRRLGNIRTAPSLVTAGTEPVEFTPYRLA